jgi:hypothetical protein
MKLSLLLQLVGGNAQLVISFRKISFPVTHLMPYYAETGSFHVFVSWKHSDTKICLLFLTSKNKLEWTIIYCVTQFAFDLVSEIRSGFFFSPLFFFFVSILWCSHIGDHAQEDLAKFGYRQRKVEQYKESCYILVTCRIYCLNMAIS